MAPWRAVRLLVLALAARSALEAESVSFVLTAREGRGLEVKTLVLPAPVVAAAIAPSGTLFLTVESHYGPGVTGTGPSKITIWDMRTQKALKRWSRLGGTMGIAVFSSDSKYVLTDAGDTAQVWQAKTGMLLHTLEGHTGKLISGVFSSDGKYVLTASEDRTARLWDAKNGTWLRTLEGHTDRLTSAAFSSDGKYVLTASWDGTARVWDAEAGAGLHTLKGHIDLDGRTTKVISAEFSPDGKYIVTACEWMAKVWDAEAGTPCRLQTLVDICIKSAAFSPDGKYVLTRGGSGTASVWVSEAGTWLRTLEGRRSGRLREWFSSAAFSPDGKYVLTRSTRGTARVWDAENWSSLMTVNLRRDHISQGPTNGGAMFSADGKWFLVHGSFRRRPADGTQRGFAMLVPSPK